jgi:hypothetical protein
MSCETLKHLRHLSTITRGRLLHPRHLRGGPRHFHGQLPARTPAPRAPSNGLIRVRLLLLQINTSVHQLPPASSCAPDRKDDYTSQAHEKTLAQHPLARNPTTTLLGRLHVHCPFARSNTTTPTQPRRSVAAPTRPPTQPQERPMGANANGRPPRPRDRPPERRVSSPRRQIADPLQASLSTTQSRSVQLPLATR